MKQQLFINSLAVDMPTEQIKITAESNILSDADKIKTAHSYNIVLPRTLLNDTIFKLAFVPASKTGGISTHTYLNCSLYIDGIQLFSNGEAVVTSVDDKGYNVNLFWGITGAFDEIKREGLKCNELAMSEHWNENLEVWQLLSRNNATLSYVSGMNNDIYQGLTSESKAEVELKPWTLPVVETRRVLDNIMSVYGINVEYSPNAELRIAELRHPLTTLNSKCKDEELVIKVKSGINIVNGNKHLTFAPVPYDTFGNIDYSTSGSGDWQATNKYSGNNAVGGENRNSGYLWARNEITFKKIKVSGTCDWDFSVILNNDGDNEEIATATPIFGGGYRIDKTWENVKIPYGQIVLNMGSSTSTSSSQPSPNHAISVELEVDTIDGMTATHTSGVRTINNWYPWTRNYPNIEITKYIGEILAHIGGFIAGGLTEKSTIQIVCFDEVIGTDAVDYSMEGLKSITMALNNLAQKNVYKHKENDDVGNEYLAEGAVLVDDNTLVQERNAFESSFRVPYNALIRLWSVEENVAKWVGGSDYICGEDTNTNPNSARNTGQDFATILTNYYANYRNVVRQPKVVEVVVRLSILDLLQLDLIAPIYIKELGRSYAIVSIESDSGDKYKIKLIQI